VRYLLDTQAVLWLAHGDRRVRQSLRDEILTSEAWVSIASLWEIAIKRAIGKLEVADDFPDWVAEAGFPLLPIAVGHVWATRSFPLHHRDPFDRLLASQALAEGLTVVTSDPAISLYGCNILRI
jgi:PIN domain nuclease of toxin-antitoxin system